MRKWVFILILLCSGSLFAQQDAHFSQYMFNGLVLNPAYAGSRGAIVANLFARKQWFGIEGAPFTQTFSFHLPDKGLRHGFGLSVTNDRIGYVNQQWLNLSYAYRIPLGNNVLALGLQGGLLNYRINWDQALTVDPNDLLIPGNSQNLIMPNVGTGVYFQSDAAFVGLSIPHLLNARLPKTTAPPSGVFARLYRHVFLSAGYVFNREGAIKVKPSALLKYVHGAPMEVDVNLSFLFANRLWAGISWRSFDAIVGMAEFNITRQIRLGYAYDLTISGLRHFTSGSHELFLSLEIQYKDNKLISPRYF